MALVDDLLEKVENGRLREALSGEIAQLRDRKKFGLVFERHIPELVVVTDAPIKVGSVARRRDEPDSDTTYEVQSITANTATILPLRSDSLAESVSLSSLASVKSFGEPVYPALALREQVDRRTSDKPVHTVINGENFHALQLLSIFGREFADCIYIDPPYNTGAQDWKYNNRFVDKKDRWRHSKWLSFMERRLLLAKTILKLDGTLVISIDENEHAHLVCLLEQIFPGRDITSVAIVHNPRGIQGDNFSITNDFAVFVTPSGNKVISSRLLPDSAPRETRFRVWGNESERSQARNCFYPIFVEDDVVVGFGPVPPKDFHPPADFQEVSPGRYEVWPIDNNGIERKWRNERKTVEGVAHLLRPQWIKGRLQIRIDKDTAMHKSVWTGAHYDAGSHGKRLLSTLGVDFDYPKSLYTMRDILSACTGDRKDAVILDYMGGSGTTLHATWLLNAEDGGTRRCILVTNNEISAKTARKLYKQSKYPGDPAYEARGIFRSVTVPRCMAALTGQLKDGQAVPGHYAGGRARSEGFDEAVSIFDLAYLDPDDVELFRSFQEIEPLLWLASGSAQPYESHKDQGFFIDESNGYAVLFDDALMSKLEHALRGCPGIFFVFHVTDSRDAFAEFTARIGSERQIFRLYGDYLEACRRHARVAP